jgi:predicted RNA binding protein YcfA (HicA-like mRNA interferase family)
VIELAKIAELLRNPREMRFKEVETILYNYGYELVNSRGSHFRFKKKDFPSITVVAHGNKVKKWYVKSISKILLTQLPL